MLPSVRSSVPRSSVRWIARAACAVGALFVVAACTHTKIIQESGGGAGDEDPAGTGARREAKPCKPGGTTLPVDAYDINPDAESGQACAIENVLDDDGNVAGLDAPTDKTHEIDGRAVSGCVAAEFGEGITLTSLTMKMRPTAQGCGHECTPGADGCGTGAKLAIFAGPSLKRLAFIQELPLTSKDFFEYRIALYSEQQARFVAICREPKPQTGDDVAIDAIYGFCK
jgi:hypothetical protein